MRLQLPRLGAWQAEADMWSRSGWYVRLNVLTQTARLCDPRGKTVMRGPLEECLAKGRRLAPLPASRSAVILLHGLGRTRRCMTRLERAVLEAGYTVANIGYPSLRLPLERHVAQLQGVAAALAEDGATTIHIIAHSLGGLLARTAMAQGLPAMGQLLTLGTPHQGASLADRLLTYAPYRIIFGACGMAATRAQAYRVPLPNIPIGVIAGGNGARGYNRFLSGDNDGIVTVAETRLGEHEAGFLRVPVIHTLIMADPRVIRASLAFVAHGRMED